MAVHFDNFTVFAALIAWVMMTAIVVLAVWYRRRNYELFLYTHYLVIGVLVTIVFHAWCAWYFLLPPLLLWLLDKSLRIARTRAVMVSITPHPDGITCLNFPAFPTPHRPGSRLGHFSNPYSS